jgi:ParB/RepB/Spo0J family partition protein
MSDQPKTKLKSIPLQMIRENPVALRSVNTKDEEYISLVDSVRRRGILNAIVVREVKDPETGVIFYGLVDGLHRYTAAGDAGLTEIPANVIAASDADVLEAQIIANIHKIETRPVEYTHQLMRILAGNPTMTASDLAGRLAKSSTWVSERLSLDKLIESIAKIVDEGKIVLANAYALAKLPAEEQTNFIDRAMTMQPPEFIPTANARLKELRDAKRQGRDPSKHEFVAVPHLRKISEIKSELEHPEIGPMLINEIGAPTPQDAFNLAIKWVLHMDDLSIAAAKKKDEEHRAKEEQAKIARKKEREEAKLKAAAEAQVGAKEAAGIIA